MDPKNLDDQTLQVAIDQAWQDREKLHRQYKALCDERSRREAIAAAKKAIESIPAAHRAAAIAAVGIAPTSAVGTPGGQ